MTGVDRGQSPPPPWNVDDVTRAMSKGVVLVHECPRVHGGAFQFFGGRMTSRGQCPRGVLVDVLKAEGDDVTRAMSKGGGACECIHPPPLQENPVSAPAIV